MTSMMTTIVKANPLRQQPDKVAVGLGWFSIALGLAALLAPAAVERRTGLKRGRSITRLTGLREVATGVGLLTADDRSPWLAARVAGDAMDVALLLGRRRSGAFGETAMALAAVAGVAMLDAAASIAVKNQAQHDRALAFDYGDRVGIRRPGTGAATSHAVGGRQPDPAVRSGQTIV